MTESQEKLLFNERGIRVTDRRIMADGRIYYVAHVTSVAFKKSHKRGELSGLVAGFLMVLMVLGILISFIFMARQLEEGVILGILLIMGSIGLSLIARKSKTMYMVDIHLASGEVFTYVSEDESFARRLLASINKSII